MSHVYSNTKQRKYQHLSLKEREYLEIHLSKGDLSVAQIASLLRRHRSTIYREIKRGLTLQRKMKKYSSSDPLDPGYVEFYAYFSETGQRYAVQRQGCRAGRFKILNDLPLLRYIDQQILDCHYTPEAVIGGLKTHPHPFSYVPHPRSIYHYIDRGLLNAKNLDLPLKCRIKTKHKRQRKNKRLLGRSIEERPVQVNDRAEFGHFEADSIVGKEEKSSALTLTERKTRRSVILKVRNKTAQETLLTLADHIRSLPQGTVKSVTFDNGTEFSSCAKLEDLFGCKVYFAHPYSAFERGTNENFNGLVRRFIPKGKNLAKYTRQDLNRIADIINTMPRKVLGYRSAAEAWELELKNLHSPSLRYLF